MDNQIEEVKSKTDIVNLVNEYVALKKAGRNYKALCPFHPEKTPSFMVSPDLQIFKCFGCNEAGDCFAFWRKIEGASFGEALKTLAQRAGVKLKRYEGSSEDKQRETFLEIHRLAANFYHKILTSHPLGKTALNYLRSRKITSDSIGDFELGFAPSSWEILTARLRKKGFETKELINAGISVASEKGAYDRFRGRIIFPIRNTQGNTIGFSARALGSAQPKYLNSPSTSIFDKAKVLYGLDIAKTFIKKEGEAILVEGNLDVISSHQVGVRHVVAPLGTALTLTQLSNLKKFGSRLSFCFDLDIAGDEAGKRWIQLAQNLGFDIKVIPVKKSKDPDELIRENPNLWRRAVKEATPVYDFLIDSAVRKYGVDTAYGKKSVAKEVFPQLAKITDEIVRAHYLKKLAETFSLSEEVLFKAIQPFLFEKEKVSLPKIISLPITNRYLLEKYLLSLSLQSEWNSKDLVAADFEDKELKEIFAAFKKYLKENKVFKLKKFIDSLPKALVENMRDLVLIQVDEDLLTDQELIRKEILDCKKRLKLLNLKEKLKDLGLEIKQAEIAHEENKLATLNNKFRDLSLKLTQLR